MDTAAVVRDFREKVCAEIDLEQSGINRYVVHTPFQFDDGDHYVIVLRREGDAWLLTDEAHTFMHLSYEDVDLDQGARGKLIGEALATYGLEDRSGEVRVAVPNGQFGDALFSMVQGLDRITSAALWTREAAKASGGQNCPGGGIERTEPRDVRPNAARYARPPAMPHPAPCSETDHERQ